MDEVQPPIAPNDIAPEEKRDLAGNNEPRGSSGPAFRRTPPKKRGAFKRSTPPPKKTSGGSRSGKFDESKHKRAADGKFSKTQGSKKKDSKKGSSTPVRGMGTISVRRGDGMSANKQNAAKIKKVQAALIKAGMLSTKGGGADGKAGPLTEAAIKKWQKKNGYKPTGAMGPLQIRELMSGKKGLARKMWKDRKRKEAMKKRKTSGPETRVNPIPKKGSSSSGTVKPKKNQTNMYSPDRAEMQRLEQLARRNAQIDRLIDLLFRSMMQTKTLQSTTETKVRRVRTPAGENHFGQPIGTIIVADSPLSFIKIGKSVFDGWDKVDGKDGSEFYVGQFDGEKGFVATDVDDNVIVEASNIDDLYRSLDRKVGESLDPKAPSGLTKVASDYAGWDKYEGGGKQVYVGQFEDEDVYVATDSDDNVIAEADTKEEVLAAINAGGPKTTTPESVDPEPEPATTASAIKTLIANGARDMSDEDKDKIKRWSETASEVDLRDVFSGVRVQVQGDRRRTSTARALAVRDILKNALREKETEKRNEERARNARKRGQEMFKNNGPHMQRAKRMLDNPAYADPDILSFSDLESLSNEFSGVIGAYRDTGRTEEADKLLGYVLAAQKRIDELDTTIREYMSANIARRKQMADGELSALDPVERDQLRGKIDRFFGMNKTQDARIDELRGVLRTGRRDAVSVREVSRDMTSYALGRSDVTAMTKVEEALATIVEQRDREAASDLLNRIVKTLASDNPKLDAENVRERLQELERMFRNTIDLIEQKAISTGDDMHTNANENQTERKALVDSASNYDQIRMYSQFDRAVEAKDMQTAEFVGRRIINDAKANGSRPGVIQIVEDTLSDED